MQRWLTESNFYSEWKISATPYIKKIVIHEKAYDRNTIRKHVPESIYHSNLYNSCVYI